MRLESDYVFDHLEIKDFKTIEYVMDHLIENMHKMDSMNAPYMDYRNSKFVITRNVIQSLPPISILSYYKGIPIEIRDIYSGYSGCNGYIKLYFDPEIDKPKKTTYKRTGYDGSTKCPCCGRNFCFSSKLYDTQHEVCVPDRLKTVKVFDKICNFCGSSFSFYWDKEDNEYKYNIIKGANIMPPKDYKETTVKFCFDNSILKPHIDHVKFNGPATIVFWKDGTKTIVKHDGKGRKNKRQAILYAFIRKIYGEGKSYHNILNEIEEALE